MFKHTEKDQSMVLAATKETGAINPQYTWKGMYGFYFCKKKLQEKKGMPQLPCIRPSYRRLKIHKRLT